MLGQCPQKTFWDFPFAFYHSTVPLPDLLIQVVLEVFWAFPHFLLLSHQDRLGIFVLGYGHTSQITQINASHPTLAFQHSSHCSTKLMPHNMLVIVYGQFFGQYRKIFLVNTAKYSWSIQQRSLGHYRNVFLVNTAKYFCLIQQNILGKYSTFPRLSMDFGQSIFPLRIFS